MATKAGTSARCDWSECEGVEPVFVFDAGSGQFMLDLAKSQWRVDRELQEQQISQAGARRSLARLDELAGRMKLAPGLVKAAA